MACQAVPMDIGNVGGDGGEEYFDDESVYAVGSHVRCHSCGGYGHMARQCPTKSKPRASRLQWTRAKVKEH